MRIAVFHNLPSGGAKRSLQGAIRGLARDHQIDVYTLESADHAFADLRPYSRRHEVFGFTPLPLLSSPLGRLNQVSRLIDLWRLRGLGRAIAQRVERNGYDVALIHPCRYENSPSLLRYLTRTPSVLYCHEPLRLLYEPMPDRPYEQHRNRVRASLDHFDPLPRLFHAALRKSDRENVRRTTMVLVNSEYSRERVRSAYGVEAYVSYPGVDTNLFRPQGLARSRAVLAVGSLTPLKGHDFLIQALARISRDHRPPLWIASNFENPAERAYLEQLARDLGVELNLASAVDDSRLASLYNQAAVTVFVPIREPLGLVALESMACGTAVVGVDEGGIPEAVIDGSTGLLVPRDPDSLANAILRLLDDPALAQEFGKSGRSKAVADWSWEVAVATLGKWLSRAAAMPSQASLDSAVRSPAHPGSLKV